MDRRRLLLFALAVLAVSYLAADGLGDSAAGSAEREALDRDRLIQPEENGTHLWPYTSRTRSTDGRALAINLIIHGSDERVRQALIDRSELEWEETDPKEEDTYEPTVEEGTMEWDDARGSTRYTYFDTEPNGGEGRWVDESYQLHAGAYLGSRYHIRAYTTESDDWTAIQVHQEYWDWFRLRHTVTDIQEPRNEIETEFLDQPYVEEVRREYHGTNGSWNDGWTAVIELATVGPFALVGVLGLVGMTAGETLGMMVRGMRDLFGWVYTNVHGFVLAAGLAGLFLGVRSAGLVLEAALPAITPKAFVVFLYPVLVVGLPLVTIVLTRPLEAATRLLRLRRGANWLGRPLKPQPAFVFTVVGLGTAFVLDFAGLGVTTLPIRLILHRSSLLFALGLIAAGTARSDVKEGIPRHRPFVLDRRARHAVAGLSVGPTRGTPFHHEANSSGRLPRYESVA
ncbi:hypothetical protein [Halalkalicoccus salilacus]|uniref:hypothetical protein n=1 Tax=Halalkalicoccus sp. GCM10025704 TaxID=3252662 RepID=UPI003620699E